MPGRVARAGSDGHTPNGAAVTIVYTIGYQDHAQPESLIDKLVSAGIAALVDVRDLPLSRRRGFSKTALSDALQDAGMSYFHMRELGNSKPYRDLYRSGDQETGEKLYRTHLRNGSSRAVDELADLIGSEIVCMLCFESDHRTCHRSVIVDELKRRLPQLEAEHL